MTDRFNKRRRRFVVLPAQGVSGKSMQASVFRSPPRTDLSSVIADQFGAFGASVENASFVGAASAGEALAAAVGDDDFEVVSQLFGDGPAMVRMTQAARLAFEANHPSLRVLPITRYHLPGRSPRGARAAAAGGGRATGLEATQADGTVFMGDLKQHVLAGLAPGAAQGAGVTVGVIDTGVDGSHPALKRNVAVSRCLIHDASPHAGGPVDWGLAGKEVAGHGTHVAGIIAGEAGHGGPAGVAPQAKVASYRVFPDDPGGPTGAENIAIIDSIRAAIDDGCHVVNLSLEGPGLKEDGVRSAIADAWNQGVVCIAAAGNSFGRPVSYPAALPHCVAVTAIGRDGAFPQSRDFLAYVSDQRSGVDPATFLATFSNYGPQVQFTAPGHAIVSTFPGGAWWFDSGTSMAAPFVSGMLARLLSENSNILAMAPAPERSAAMLQMLVGRAKMLALPQVSQEGYGLPA